jgi:hypothetical protein
MSTKSTVKLNLDLNYNRSEPTDDVLCPYCQGNLTRHQQPPQGTNSELTGEYLRFAVASSHPDGVGGQARRIWGRIDRAIDEALDQKNTSIEIERAGYEFLKKSIDKCKVNSRLVKFFVILEDEIQRAGENKEE